MAPKHVSSDDGSLNVAKKSCKDFFHGLVKVKGIHAHLLLESQVTAALPDECLVKMEKALNMHKRVF